MLRLMYGPTFGMDPEMRSFWRAVYAGVAWFFVSPRIADGFIMAYSDPARGNLWPPRAPFPGVGSAAGELLLMLALAYGPFVAATAVARYASGRAREQDTPVYAWAVAARIGLWVGIPCTLGLLAYMLLRLRPV